MSFFERPVQNSPYPLPEGHWELDATGRPTDRILETRRSSELLTELPTTSVTSARTQTSMVIDEALSTATSGTIPSRIVNNLRQELAVWRQLVNFEQWNVPPTKQPLLQHRRAIQGDETQLMRPFLCQLESRGL